MTTAITDDVLRAHHVLVATDKAFQRRARMLQALWREERGFPIGERRAGVPLGSRLEKKFASESGVNLMTASALAAARHEVAAMRAGSGQKIDEDRLWANLLSSTRCTSPVLPRVTRSAHLPAHEGSCGAMG